MVEAVETNGVPEKTSGGKMAITLKGNKQIPFKHAELK